MKPVISCLKTIIALLFLAAPQLVCGQAKYWVFFTDKAGCEQNFDPYKYFHKNTLERRVNAGLPLYDFTDLPVNQSYINTVCNFADSMGNVSRWFNGVGVWASEENIKKIAQLPFVNQIELMCTAGEITSASQVNNDENTEVPDVAVELLHLQLTRLQGQQFRQNNITGKGVRIAILDVGFKGADKHPAFKHIFSHNRVNLTHDFIKNSDYVYSYGSHGTMVMSCIAGFYNDTIPMGLATGSEFILARTERGITEWKDEEDNWVAAAEWADKNGAQIINSSLGYTYKRYFYRNMNGRTSYVAKGANMAARKGILVVTAAGNDGKNDWKYICTPGDADSALTVGGTDPFTNYHINFSSYGPSADEKIKPNVSAPGQVWVANPSNFSQAYGTSFSTPLTAGFAACVWSMNPKLSNMQLFREIEHSGNLYPYFDYAHGFGVPQADYFISKYKNGEQKKEKAPTFKFTNGENISIILNDAYKNGSFSGKNLYYQLWDGAGKLIKYYVIEPEGQNAITIKHTDLPAGGKIRAHFEGYTSELVY